MTTEHHSVSPSTSPGAAPEPPSTGSSRPLFILLAVVAVLAVVTDQVTKIVAVDALADGLRRPVIGDWLGLRLIANPGAALSLGAGNTWVMTVIAVVILIAIVVVARRLGSRAWAVALGLMLGGAMGNLIDRFVREPGGGQGHVVDFIDYNGWFIGNVADIWIVGAAGLVMVLSLMGIGVDGSRATPETETRDRPETDRTPTTKENPHE